LHSVRDRARPVKDPTFLEVAMTLDIPDELVDWRTKGFWQPGPARSTGEVVAAGHGLFGGAFSWPLLVLRRSAVRANIATMASFCDRRGLAYAPHAKTTMAPVLLDDQLRAGAWGLTVATPNQALVLWALGVRRVFIANEVLDGTALRWLATESGRGFEVYFQVDSVAGVEAAAAAVAAGAGGERGGGQPGAEGLRVLVELGHPGGRTGCRTVDEVLSVARAVRAVPGLALVGVTGYEGTLPDAAAVDAWLARLTGAVRAVSTAGLLPAQVLVSAGGSAWFDRVADGLAGPWLPGHDLRVVLRSGASVSHDDGFYAEHTPFTRLAGEGSLTAALQLWAQVLSTPEPGLAIVGMGKRDAPFDEGLPVPMEVRRADGVRAPAIGLSVTRLQDQHAYLAVQPDVPVRPGDLVRFGISHPCTAFDKWRAIPVVDDGETVVDVLRTYF
jgi:D-serine deaminase-like pyridoxal phosphate-dependent protein